MAQRGLLPVGRMTALSNPRYILDIPNKTMAQLRRISVDPATVSSGASNA
jgi:hypothetical protein